MFKVKRLDPKAILPSRANPDDAGLDIHSLESYTLSPGEGRIFSTGIAGQFNSGFVGMVTDRSSMAKKGFKVAGGIIDAGYTGELSVVLRNISNDVLCVKVGDRIAQLLIIPISTPEIVEVFTLEESIRGSKGWGSSGS